MKIAYISGIEDTNAKDVCNYTPKDVQELYDVCVRGNPSFRGVDILLSSQWPSGITRNVTANQVFEKITNSGVSQGFVQGPFLLAAFVYYLSSNA